MIDARWLRWTQASFATHFKSVADGGSLPFYAEGDDHNKVNLVPDYAEYRLNGPLINELSQGWYKLLVEVSLLIVSRDDDKDAFKIYRHAGVMAAGCTRAILTYQYEDSPDPNNPLTFTCFQQVEVGGKSLIIAQLGRVDANMAQREMLINSFYEAHIFN